MTAEDLLAKASYWEGLLDNRRADEAVVERVARRAAKHDPDGANWLRMVTGRSHIETVINVVRSHVALGQLEKAERAARSFENKLALVRLEIDKSALTIGRQRLAALDEGREKVNKRKKLVADAKNYQGLADEVWQSRPNLSATAVATKIVSDLDKQGIEAKIGTVRRRIKKPVITG